MAGAGLLRQRGSFDRTQDHWWWREGWGPGIRYLTWHLTFEGATELHAAAARSGAAFDGIAHVDPVPVPWLHLTMTGVGFSADAAAAADAATAEIVAAVLEAAAAVRPEPLVFDRTYLYREGICLSADAPWLEDLKSRQVEIVAAAGGPTPAPGDLFIPHVSLAYFSGPIDETALDAALDAARLTRITVPEPRLSLLELGRDVHVYTWRVLAQRTLGA